MLISFSESNNFMIFLIINRFNGLTKPKSYAFTKQYYLFGYK